MTAQLTESGMKMAEKEEIGRNKRSYLTSPKSAPSATTAAVAAAISAGSNSRKSIPAKDRNRPQIEVENGYKEFTLISTER